VCVAGDADALRVDPAGREIVELADELLGIHDTAGSDGALLARDHPRGQVTELEDLVPDADRVTGVRAALVAADEVGLLGEQVDDLSLALVSPLRAHDDGGRHGSSLPPISDCERASCLERD
jgi:hypothetical protein